jgi:two-component system chemotaxis response regulator CheY
MRTILTIDDSRTIRDILRITLEAAGYRVVQADDGAKGLDALKANTPDLAITDINMPVLDGFGFIEGARGMERYRALPILVLSTEFDAQKKARARAAGATGWIVKPVEPTKLLDVVRRVCA